MDIRHQVFVSSTYVDLRDERQAIIQALLELDCIPAGMEMFVATDEDQWNLIREVIDLSDYYLVVVGARYGHVTEEEISYTEKEYNYAVETGKPIIAYVHANPGSVAHDMTDKDPGKEAQLEAFRKRIRDGSDGKRRNVGEFLTPDELGAKVSRSMSRAIRKYPGTGWVRGDEAMTLETKNEILELKQKIATLESEKLRAQNALAEDTEEFAQGAEAIGLPMYIQDISYPATYRKSPIAPVAGTTWDNVFREIAPSMMDEAPEPALKERLANHLLAHGEFSPEERRRIDAMDDIDFEVTDPGWDVVVVQFHALGLIEPGTKKRAPSDKQKYLTLTQKGRRQLIKLRAVKKGTSPRWMSREEATQSDGAADKDQQ